MPGARRGRCPKADEALIIATAAGHENRVPLWLVQPEHAARLHTDYFLLLDMLEHGGFSHQYGLFLQAWALQADHAAPERASVPERAVPAHWRGGACDPTEFTVFADEDAVA